MQAYACDMHIHTHMRVFILQHCTKIKYKINDHTIKRLNWKAKCSTLIMEDRSFVETLLWKLTEPFFSLINVYLVENLFFV